MLPSERHKLVGHAKDEPLRATSVGKALVVNSKSPIDSLELETETQVNDLPDPLQHGHEQLLYLGDTFISTNKGQAISLVVVCVVLAVALAPIVEAVGHTDYGDSVFRVWTYTTDTGTQNHAKTHEQKAVAFFLTLLGFVYFAVVVAFVVDAIRDKMDQLKHGRTQVVEFNHSLMLGWSDKSIPYIVEICNANESEGGGVVVVLAENDNESMEAAFQSQCTETKGTRVIFRSGNPLLAADLNMVSAHTARSICIMGTDRDAAKSDANLLRMILAINSLPELNGHVVADTSDIDNEPLLQLVGGSVIETLVSNDLMGRLIVMCSRTPGLAKVYDSLLGFSGNEFYIETWPTCVGVPFSQLPERFQDAVPLGYKDINGQIHILPKMSRIMQEGEAILVLAEDNDTYKAEAPVVIPAPDSKPVQPTQDEHAKPLKILMCGWRRDIRDMLRMLDSLSQPGTVIYLLNEETPSERIAILSEDGLDVHSLSNLTLVHIQGNPAVRRHVMQIHLSDFDSYMVLCDAKREDDVLESDSHVLASVLMLRSVEIEQHKSIAKKLFANTVVNELQSRHRSTPCIAEILDPRTQKTIQENKQIGHSSDFVQTNELISRMLAMVSENRLVSMILDELLSGKGAELDVVPATRYCQPGSTLSFYQLVKCAQNLNEIVIGYQPRNSLAPTTLNPPEKNKQQSWWDKMDLVIVHEGRRERGRKQMKAVCSAFYDALHRRRCREQIISRANHSIEVLDFANYQSIPRNVNIESTIKKPREKWAEGLLRRQSLRTSRRKGLMIKNQSDKRMFKVPTGTRLTDLWNVTEDIGEVIDQLSQKLI